jgi:hypothetical protein
MFLEHVIGLAHVRFSVKLAFLFASGIRREIMISMMKLLDQMDYFYFMLVYSSVLKLNISLSIHFFFM